MQWWSAYTSSMNLPESTLVRELWFKCPALPGEAPGDWRLELATADSDGKATLMHVMGHGHSAQYTSEESATPVAAAMPDSLMSLLDSLPAELCTTREPGEVSILPARVSATYEAGRYSVNLRYGSEWQTLAGGSQYTAKAGDWHARVSRSGALHTVWLWQADEK